MLYSVHTLAQAVHWNARTAGCWNVVVAAMQVPWQEKRAPGAQRMHSSASGTLSSAAAGSWRGRSHTRAPGGSRSACASVAITA